MDKQTSLIIIALLFVLGVFSFFNSNYFKVEQVEIKGNNILSDDYIINYCNLDREINILSIKRENLVNSLVNLAQIKGAVVQRELPKKIIIEVNERRPLAMIGINSSYLVIDKDGWILDTARNLLSWDLPLIKGVEVLSNNKTLKINPIMEVAITYLSFLPDHALEGIAQLDISKDKEINLFLAQGGEVKLGNNFDIEKKAKIFTSIYEDIVDKKIKVNYIDLRYQKNAVVKTF